MMMKILGKWVGKLCLIYIDDVVIWGDTAEQCLDRVKTIVRKLKQDGVICNGEKCCLLTTKLELLGHYIHSGKVYPQTWKLEPLRQQSSPRTIKEVQSVLGVLGYFRKFVRGYSEIAKPIYDVIRAVERNVSKKLTLKQKAR